MKKLSGFVIVLFFLSFGCVHPDGTKAPPPSPTEAGILSYTIMSIAIETEKMEVH